MESSAQKNRITYFILSVKGISDVELKKNGPRKGGTAAPGRHRLEGMGGEGV